MNSAKYYANETRAHILRGDRESAIKSRNKAENAAKRAARLALNDGSLMMAMKAAREREHAVRARKYVSGESIPRGRFNVT